MRYKIERRRDNINHRTIYIPQPVGGHTLDFKEIGQRISYMCTVTKADVAVVLEALETVVGEALSQGDSVRLGTLGSFRVRMSATPADSPAEVTSANIKEVGVTFRATPLLKQHLANAHFERVVTRRGVIGDGL